jgi:hypothetical protein
MSGLPTIKIKLIKKVNDYKYNRYRTNTEGIVVYHLIMNDTDTDDNNNNDNCIYVEKHKTYWYILIRHLRQIILSSNNDPIKTQSSIKQVLIDKNKDLLNLPEYILIKWYHLFCSFNYWFIHKPDLNRDDIDIIGMSNIWDQFIKASVLQYPSISYKHNVAQTLSNMRLFKVFVILQGIPGLGKSVLAKELINKCTSYPRNIASLEQLTYNGNLSLCLLALSKMLINPQLDTIIISNNNVNLTQYHQFAKIANDADWRVVTITPSEVTSDKWDSLVEICINSAIARESNAPFDNIDNNAKIKIIRNLVNSFQTAKLNKLVHYHNYIDWLDPVTLKRLSIDNIARKVTYLIESSRNAPPHPMHISLKLSNTSITILTNLVIKLTKDHSINIDEDQLLVSPLILYHSYSKNNKLRDILLQMTGQLITIKIDKLIIRKTTELPIIVFQCNIFKQYTTLINSNYLVDGGFPHIIVNNKHSDTPLDEVLSLKECMSSDIIIPLEDIEVLSTITNYYP